ncbi:MAG: adenylosuccinate synthetase [Pirellulaceae bacterium]|nr:adenylosuccinate synthetase [Pirellulaceae bacterium]
MARKIVLLSGPVASGKSSLAASLVDEFDAVLVKTWQLLTHIDPKVARDRESLQELGEKLDRETNGEWIAQALGKKALEEKNDAILVVDSVRIQEQIDHVRRGFGQIVFHVHLDADYADLVTRYSKRNRKDIVELKSYDDVLKNNTEKQVPSLKKNADIAINTSRCDRGDVLVRAASHLGLFGRERHRVVDVVVGGQYGSEGKGQLAAYLSPEYHLLVRVGGPNAGHKVFKTDNPDTFHILPSGSRVSNANLLIGPGAVIDVPTILREISELRVQPERLSIDPQVMIINERDREQEQKLIKEIGSTGQGVGFATARRIVERNSDTILARDVTEIAPFIRPTWKILDEYTRSSNSKILLEGTQGTGLSLYHGSYPHVTSRDTTVTGCLAEAGIAPGFLRRTIMVTRTFPIRVESPKGPRKTSGPMKHEISIEQVANRSQLSELELKKIETTSTTRKKRRIAEFDWELFRKSILLNTPTDIALTFVDYLNGNNREARRFEELCSESQRFIGEVERVANAPVSLISTRFHHRSIIDRRHW